MREPVALSALTEPPETLSRPRLRSWALNCLLPLLTSCATTEPVVVTKIERALPPAAWLQNCPIPVLEGRRVEDAVILAHRRKLALQECNRDKAKLRAWAGIE